MPLTYLGGFESTKIHGSGRDILGTTRHVERWNYDLTLLRGSGIQELRYSAPWHRIERVPGEFDFSWLDGPMEFMQRNDMRPILDPLHHTSFPDWLTDGFDNPQFPGLYARFARELARRYPWVTDFTVFNEPLPTTLFCSYTGMWYPHRTGDAHFVSMAVRAAESMVTAWRAIQHENPRARFIHVETCESHAPLDRASEEFATFVQHRRFLLHDLVLGRLDREHPLWSYMTRNGASERDLLWFQENHVQFDVLGLDYYMHSEIEWHWDSNLKRPNIPWPVSNPRGFRLVAQDYLERFRVPVMLSETNIRGTVTDRLTWLKLMAEHVESLAQDGYDVRGFCWYPSIDSTDWCHACTKSTNTVDPQGLWTLDAGRWNRFSSELSDTYGRLAQGRMGARDIPAYLFEASLDRDLRGYRKLMRHWVGWREPGPATQVA